MKHWTNTLVKMGACQEAVKWAKGYKSLQDAWVACKRGDHMLWLAGMVSEEPGSEARKRLVLAACQCTRLAMPYIQKNETRPLKTIVTAEAWAEGDATVSLMDVQRAAHAASAAAHAAAHAASAAAYAAAYAAYTAAHPAHAAYAAAHAALAAHAAERTRVLKQCADIVRQYYPVPPL